MEPIKGWPKPPLVGLGGGFGHPLDFKFEALQTHQKMAQMVGTDEIESLGIELAEIRRSITSSF